MSRRIFLTVIIRPNSCASAHRTLQLISRQSRTFYHPVSTLPRNEHDSRQSMQSGNTKLMNETAIHTTSKTNTNPHLYQITAPGAHDALPNHNTQSQPQQQQNGDESKTNLLWVLPISGRFHSTQCAPKLEWSIRLISIRVNQNPTIARFIRGI